MSFGEIIAFTCLKTTLTGDYSHSKEAWIKAKKHITDNGLKENFAGSYTEVYAKTIDDIKLPSKWITEIYIPVFPKAISLPEPVVESEPEPVVESVVTESYSASDDVSTSSDSASDTQY